MKFNVAHGIAAAAILAPGALAEVSIDIQRQYDFY